MREFYAKYNIINFPAGNTGAQMGGWFRKEIKSTKDLKGLKFRIGGFAGKLIERMGGVPQNMPGGEIYRRWKRARIDAAEWVGPYDDQKLGFNKVAPFYYYPGWWEGGAELDFFINQKAWDACRPRTRRSSRRPARRRTSTCQAKYDARNPVALEAAGRRRRQAAAFPQDMMNEAFKARDDDLRRRPRPRTRLRRRSTRTCRSSARTRTCGSASPKPPSTASCRRRSSVSEPPQRAIVGSSRLQNPRNALSSAISLSNSASIEGSAA